MPASDADPRSPAAVLLALPLSEMGEHLRDADSQALELVRFTASNNAIGLQHLSSDDRLEWAYVAVQAIQLMRSDGSQDEVDLTQKEMRLRAALIGEIGVDRSRSTLLDPETVVEWFLMSLGAETLESVEADAGLPLSELSIERLSELRAIKNNLNVVGLMISVRDGAAFPEEARLRRWLKVRTVLP